MDINEKSAIIIINKLKKTLSSYIIYIVLFFCLVVAFLFITGFISLIVDVGPSFDLNPVYNLISDFLIDLSCFSEGPFAFSFFVTFLIFLFFINIRSIPSEKYKSISSSVFHTIIHDCILVILFVIIMLFFFLIASILTNLVIGLGFLGMIPFFLLFAMAFINIRVLIMLIFRKRVTIFIFYFGFIFFTFLFQIFSGLNFGQGAGRILNVFIIIMQWIFPLRYLNYSFLNSSFLNISFLNLLFFILYNLILFGLIKIIIKTGRSKKKIC